MPMRRIAIVGTELYYTKIYRNADWNEYVVKFFEFGDYIKDADHFAGAKDDALATAHWWVEQKHILAELNQAI